MAFLDELQEIVGGNLGYKVTPWDELSAQHQQAVTELVKDFTRDSQKDVEEPDAKAEISGMEGAVSMSSDTAELMAIKSTVEALVNGPNVPIEIKDMANRILAAINARLAEIEAQKKASSPAASNTGGGKSGGGSRVGGGTAKENEEQAAKIADAVKAAHGQSRRGINFAQALSEQLGLAGLIVGETVFAEMVAQHDRIVKLIDRSSASRDNSDMVQRILADRRASNDGQNLDDDRRVRPEALEAERNITRQAMGDWSRQVLEDNRKRAEKARNEELALSS